MTEGTTAVTEVNHLLQAMFSGVSGLQAHQTRLNTIGNNIANVNTVGFKAGRVAFKDQLSQTIRSAAGPGTSGEGGTNPAQVGLGVSLGALDSIVTQGNLQATGKSTDMAIQGNGYFMVASGRELQFTRDGSFDLDSSGALVNPATGAKLLGYQGDPNGVVDTTAPVTPQSTITIPIGTLTDAKQTSNIGMIGNLDAGASLFSTKVDFTGNADSAAVAPKTFTANSTVYDNLGNAHTVSLVLSNPTSGAPLTGTGVPTGATQSWDLQVVADNSTVYDSTTGKSKVYAVGGSFVLADTTTGANLGATIKMDGLVGSNHGPVVPGSAGAAVMPLDLNLNGITNLAAPSAATGITDGQSGSAPSWGSSIQVYDSLGVGHLVAMKFTHSHLGANPPTGSTGRWDWTATENGVQIGSSSDVGNTSLFFGSNGRLVAGVQQSITVAPTDGAVTPFTIKIDNSKLTQLAADANASANSQDGYQVGTLQSFTIGTDGLITGVFSSGQSRSLGQIGMATFANPGGLEKTGSNLLRDTANSGAAQIGIPSQGGRGKITPGYLENSNVDLSGEFTQLIITERGFQANTKIISTIDSLLQDVINLKR